MMTLPSLLEPFDAALGADLIEAVGRPNFAPLLLQSAQAIDHIEEVFAYALPDDGPPQSLASCSTLTDQAQRAGAYAQHFFRHDPLLENRQAIAGGGSFGRCVRVSDIKAYDYRAICFERPRFVDKLSFGWRGDGQTLMLSFYRRRSEDPLAAARLSGLAGITLSALARHALPATETSLLMRIDARLAIAYPALTARERQVCAASLAGWTAARTAVALGIGKGSVLTYRRRAYARLGISSAQQLLPGIIA